MGIERNNVNETLHAFMCTQHTPKSQEKQNLYIAVNT